MKMEAIALNRTHGAHSDQLRVVAQPQITRQASKGLIEDEFAIAVTLEIKRRHCNQAVLAPPDRQVQWLPALIRSDAAGVLKGCKPGPSVKRTRMLGEQPFPL